MKHKLYSIYDSKSETYSAPMSQPSRGAATRLFIDAVNGLQDQLTAHSEDFTLFEIGEFDIATGDITVFAAKISVGNGLDFKKTN